MEKSVKNSPVTRKKHMIGITEDFYKLTIKLNLSRTHVFRRGTSKCQNGKLLEQMYPFCLNPFLPVGKNLCGSVYRPEGRVVGLKSEKLPIRGTNGCRYA